MPMSWSGLSAKPEDGPGSQAAGTEGAPHGAAHTAAARATFLPALRHVARVAHPDLDQSPLHRAVSALEGGLAGLVLGRGAVGPGPPASCGEPGSRHDFGGYLATRGLG